MISLEVHPEVQVREQFQRPERSTCFECHRSFRAKSEDQLSLGLCAHCFDTARHITEPILSIHVKVLPRKPLVL
jgi:protein-arginine kinase activator protein McsA